MCAAAVIPLIFPMIRRLSKPSAGRWPKAWRFTTITTPTGTICMAMLSRATATEPIANTIITMSLLDPLLNDFFWRALLGGLGVALLAGPLGCFVVWRRMAYFGDTLAHSALLGIALSFLISVPLNLAVIITCVVIALALVLLSRTRALSTDTLLGILAHSALAIGLVTLSFMPEVRVDLTGLLFGDLLAMSRQDLLWIYGGAAVVLTLLAVLWRGLLMSTIHEELARVEGVPVERLRLALMLMFSLVIAVAMKIVGVLLITALLVIPAATARRLAKNPE